MQWIPIVMAAVNIVLWLVTLRYMRKSGKDREPSPAAEREARVFKLYQEIETMLDSFEQYVPEVHEELERERAALNETARQAQMLLMQAMEKAAAIEKLAVPVPVPAEAEPPSRPPARGGRPKTARPEDAPEPKPSDSRLSERDRQTLAGLDTKARRVRFLMSRGFAVDEIARELNIGIGEIRLITDLDK
ncbi:MAG: hypothetical protein FWG93_06680, partial [Oscillospiraceae bacterium]|nr:hypothetical protein [Oscillospiraceae bacterium]